MRFGVYAVPDFEENLGLAFGTGCPGTIAVIIFSTFLSPSVVFFVKGIRLGRQRRGRYCL